MSNIEFTPVSAEVVLTRAYSYAPPGGRQYDHTLIIHAMKSYASCGPEIHNACNSIRIKDQRITELKRDNDRLQRMVDNYEDIYNPE